MFLGDLKVKFNDGGGIKGRLMNGDFSGIMIGENKFETYGNIYAYDNNTLVCSYSTKNKSNNYF